MVVVKYIIILLNFIEIISGNNKVISTSKIKKMIAMRKKDAPYTASEMVKGDSIYS
jgi:hypothetical protein